MPLSEWIMCGTYIQWNTTQKFKKKKMNSDTFNKVVHISKALR